MQGICNTNVVTLELLTKIIGGCILRKPISARRKVSNVHLTLGLQPTGGKGARQLSDGLSPVVYPSNRLE